MNRDAQKIVNSIADAISSATRYNPQDLREAAVHILGPNFGAYDATECAAAKALADLLIASADRKEKLLRKAFGKIDQNKEG
jgi:hypothetical protein